jgi:hypothetical protein
MTSFIRRLRPLPASLVLVGMALAAAVLLGVASVMLVPIIFAMALFATWLVASLFLGWAGIEALAAFERWIENGARFLR